MSSIPPNKIRKVNTVISLSLKVNDGIVSTHIESVIPPFSARQGLTCCGGVLRSKEGRYAMICGRYTDKWGFPKGKQEDGEELLESALREIEEEVGIWRLDPPAGKFTVGKQVYFIFDVDECLPLCPSDTLEVSETRWVTLDEMKQMDTNLGVKAFIKWTERGEQKKEMKQNRSI